jgi:hypothetical protein
MGVRGDRYTHVPCPFGALLVTLYQFFSEGFALNGERDIGGGASHRWGLAPPKKKIHPGK